jgi:hypothetical protein
MSEGVSTRLDKCSFVVRGELTLRGVIAERISSTLGHVVGRAAGYASAVPDGDSVVEKGCGDDREDAEGAADDRSSSSHGVAAVDDDARGDVEGRGVEPGGERAVAEQTPPCRIDLQGLGICLLYQVLVVLHEKNEAEVLVPSRQGLRLPRRPSSSILNDAT